MDPVRLGKGPLGALPALSATARRALAFTGILALLNAGALIAQAFLLASILADLVDNGAEALGATTTRVAILAALVVARSVIGWGIRVVAVRAAAGAKEELRAKTVDHTLRLGPEWINDKGHAQLTALTTRGLDALDGYFAEYLPALVTAAVVPVGAGAAVLVADWPSAVLIAITIPLLPMFAILVGKYTADRVSTATDALMRMSGHLLELVRALPVLAAFRRAEAQADAVRRVSEQHRKSTLSTLRVAFSSAFVLELAATLSVALVAVVIGVRLVSGDLTLAIGLGVLLLAPECYQPLRNVGAAFHASEDGVEAVRRVTDVLATPAQPNGTRAPVRGDIRITGLRVERRNGYAPDGESHLITPGSTTWLRSPSGAGKSTTLSVLLGFTTPAAGSITVAGTPLAELEPAAWRDQIAWVPQIPAFAGGTARDELGTTDAAERVLAELGIEHVIDTPVNRLSTGQRQRLAVARALLRLEDGAWLLLLDEPTAHLDQRNADRVMVAVENARKRGAAVVIAAHQREDGADLVVNGIEVTEKAGTSTNADAGKKAPATLRLRELVNRRFAAGVLLGAGALLAGVALTATSGWLIAKASQQPPILTLTVAVVGVRAFGLARAVLRYTERLHTHDAAFRVAADLREKLWRTLVRLGPAHTLGLRGGEGQRRLVADVDTVRDLVPRVLTPPAVACIVIVGAVVIQTAVLPSAGLALAVAMLLAVLLAPSLALLAERKATSALAEGRRDIAARVLTLFGSSAELLAYGRDRELRAELGAADARLVASARRQAFAEGTAEAVTTLATGFAAVASTVLAAGAVAEGALSPVLAPIVALVPLALAEVVATLPPAAQHWDTLRTARRRLAETFEHPTPAKARTRDNAAISIRGADLHWPARPEPVLTGVDIDIPAGSKVAVVGPSGGGKSTLLATLLGFVVPRVGEATVPERVAWAPQEPQLVSTTVAENLRLGNPHATTAQLEAALSAAVLPAVELGTVLGSEGSGLSGGQAGRLAVARALLAAETADVVLLDEPTAHLDAATADELLGNLRTRLEGKTVIHVTHRPDEAADADLVLHVENGGVITKLTAREAVMRSGGA
ncbi:glutathione/cysteine ABC transporter permease/ATP-binding protein [Prauserella marina]|nr:glutathione/cysteine ABC transporter permease/ATP-binding protein [Prauserella marina]